CAVSASGELNRFRFHDEFTNWFGSARQCDVDARREATGGVTTGFDRCDTDDAGRNESMYVGWAADGEWWTPSARARWFARSSFSSLSSSSRTVSWRDRSDAGIAA